MSTFFIYNRKTALGIELEELLPHIDIGWGVVYTKECHVTCTLFYYTLSQVSFTTILLLCVYGGGGRKEEEDFWGATDGGHYTSMKDPFNLHQRWKIRANQFTVKNGVG